MMAAFSAPVMAGLDPAIHVEPQVRKSWMPGSSPGMTVESVAMSLIGNLLISCP